MFVQCAVMADPERLADEPLILVGGSPTGRGVVTSASYGCRAFGVRSAMPMATALRLCPDATVVRVPGEMIRRKSRELREELAQWTPVMAVASVDEAYLDLTGTEALHRHAPLPDIARKIQRAAKAATGLDVSIGGGSNRLVAKLATAFAKPNGVFVVPAGGEDGFVAGLRKELSRRGINAVSVGRDRLTDDVPDARVTKRGEFTITAKHVTALGSDVKGFANRVEMHDVPWVLKLSSGQLLHGAYWHNRFGIEHGPGNVQLSPADAHWLFHWAGPAVPKGWHAVVNTELRAASDDAQNADVVPILPVSATPESTIINIRK